MADFNVNPNYKIKLIEISGRFTIENREDFQALVKDKVDFTQPATCIDATDLGYIDSSGLGELLRLKTQAAKQNHAVQIFGLSESIMKMFKMSKLDHVFVMTTKEEFLKNYS